MIILGVLVSSFIQLIAISAIIAYAQYITLRAGVFSLAPAGFALIGAYTAAILEIRLDLPVLVSSILAVLAGAVAGFVLGLLTRKLRGVYQAIATLAFVMILQQLTQVWTSVTGGAGGLIGVPNWAGTNELVVLIFIVMLLIWVIDRSITGFQMSACRIDEIASASLGVNVAKHRLIALVISGALGALGGVAYGANQFAISPEQFGFPLVVSTLVAVIVGSYRFWLGPIIGVFVLQAITQIFAPLSGYAALIQGILLLFVMIFMPEGIVGSARPLVRRLLHRRAADLNAGGLDEVSAIGPAPDRRSSSTGPLVIDHIQRSYSGIKAVADVSLEIAPGQILGLIGPNGAGKSTVINLVGGHSRLDAGTVRLDGEQIGERRQFEIARTGVVRTFQTCRLFNEFTVRQNVELAAIRMEPRRRLWHALRPVSRETRRFAHKLLVEVGAENVADRIATSLTYSDQRRVEVARALGLAPKFLLLDEPAAGMRQHETEQLGALIRQLSAQGIGVLVVDHNVGWILGLCSHVVVQQLGRVIAEGEPAEIRDSPTVQAAYLGMSNNA